MPIIPSPFSNYGWGSSEYYHRYATNPGVGVPNNYWGFQEAKSGDAYAGFFMLASDAQNMVVVFYKEYIEVKLLQPLTKNYLYNFELYYTISGDQSFEINPDGYYPITIEALLTDTVVYRTIDTTTPNYVENIQTHAQLSHILPTQLDTTSWLKMSYDFRAKGGERYLTIGNFDDVSNLSHYKGILVYIDDVSLTYIGPDTTPILEPEPVQLFPNPAKDMISIEQKNGSLQGMEIQLFDLSGRLVLIYQFSEDISQKELPVFHLSSGMYLYTIRKDQELLDKGKLIVIK
jgi:hypothetical protein